VWDGFGREPLAERDELRREQAALVEDREACVERLVDGDGDLGIAEPTWPREDLEDDLFDPDGVVAGDDTVVLEAEHVVELGSPETRRITPSMYLPPEGHT
jgi:hypothetical protein